MQMLTIRLDNGQGAKRTFQFRAEQIHVGFRRGADIELEPFDKQGSEILLRAGRSGSFAVEPVRNPGRFQAAGRPLDSALTLASGTALSADPYTLAVEIREQDASEAAREPDAGRPAGEADRDAVVATDASHNYLALFFAPVAPFLEDDSVSEVMINGPDQIFIERKGKVLDTPARFINEQALQAAVKNVARSVNRSFNEENPRLDARLPDGSRVHAVIPPMSRRGTTVAIRKFSKERLTVEQLIQFGSLTAEAAQLLRTIVRLHKNLIVSGATSSGKTSVLNVLSSFIEPEQRIIVIEDSSELQLQQEHLVLFETRKADEFGKGEVAIRDLLHSSLRLRPDRIVIGEIRGGEALDLLQALNTGHGGSMSTVHANSPVDTLSRLETCALLSGVDMPLSALRAQVASAIEVVVQTARLADGSRKITHVTEVLGLERGEYKVQDLIRFYPEGLDDEGRLQGRHAGGGVEPTFAAEAKMRNLPCEPAWFAAPR